VAGSRLIVRLIYCENGTAPLWMNIENRQEGWRARIVRSYGTHFPQGTEVGCN
jgi:hypothetical protein